MASKNPLSKGSLGDKRKLRIYYYDIVAPTPLESLVVPFAQQTRAQRRIAASAAPPAIAQPAIPQAGKPDWAEDDQRCDNCGCDNEHVKWWAGGLQPDVEIVCDACGKYFEKHKVARPERVWNPAPEAEDDEDAEDDVEEVPLSRRTHDPRSTLPTFFGARLNPNPSDDDEVEPDTSRIPLPLRTFDPGHTLPTFLAAYTNHLAQTIKVRRYLEATVQPLLRRRRPRRPAVPRYSLPLPHPHNNEDAPANPSAPDEYEDDVSDLLIEEEGREILTLIAKHLYDKPLANWDDKLLWLDASIPFTTISHPVAAGAALAARLPREDGKKLHTTLQRGRLGITRSPYRLHELAGELADAQGLKEMSREMQRLDETGAQREIDWFAPASPGRFSDIVVEALGYHEGAHCDDEEEDRVER